MSAPPLISWSGRFVWLVDDARWPSAFSFDAGGAPFESETYPAPPPPADPARIPAAERLIRITLRPSAAYPSGDGLSAVRARLLETEQPDAAPLPGALVWIRWTDTARNESLDGPVAARTNAGGDFATCLRLPGSARPARNGSAFAVRIVVAHAGELRQHAQDLPDGRLLDLPAALAWSALSPSEKLKGSPHA